MNQPILNSQYRLRTAIGLLGISLPVLLLLSNKGILLSSMSHYYYSSGSVFFIGILAAFGLVLFAYRGYDKDPNIERFSDDWLTTAAAFFIGMAILDPTDCTGSMGPILFCGDGYLFGYSNDMFRNSIHLFSAGIFLAILGYMCYFKFTLSPNISSNKRLFYKASGLVVWGSIGMIIALIAFEKFIYSGEDLNDHLPGFVFILETIAVWAFGVAWLIKGRIK